MLNVITETAKKLVYRNQNQTFIKNVELRLAVWDNIRVETQLTSREIGAWLRGAAEDCP